jgi:sugar/nucleoside kinase (ribokinase family)
MAAVGALGDDEWGSQVAAVIDGEGVDLSMVRHEGTTTTVVVLVGRAGEHVFLGKYGHGGKIEFSQSKREVISRGGAIYCVGYTLLETRLLDLALEAMRCAKESGVPVYFDPGPQMIDVLPEVSRQLLPLIDTLMATEEEISIMAGDGSIDSLLRSGPHTVVVKRGAAGCAIHTGRSATPVVDLPAYPVSMVDTSAAGDSFNAAYIVASLWGWSRPDCARLANAVGAAKVRKLGGGRNVPTLAEVREIINQFEIDIEL